MKKLLFRKLIKDILVRTAIIVFSLGLIVWVIQATNYLDFIIDDGHNFKIYFFYSLFNFPKIISRILPFVFFLSVFFELLKYEKNNETLIYWTNGISRKKFINVIIILTFFVTFFQILLSSYLSPLAQAKARKFIKESKIDFLPSLLKQGKFIDNISDLTIFIDKKDNNNIFKNIYIQEGLFSNFQNNNRLIFAKEGSLIDNNGKIFRLKDGKIISTNNKKLISFEFDTINYDLSKFKTKSITKPKIQELPSMRLIRCSYNLLSNNEYMDKTFNCELNKLKEFNKELYKRFIKPFFIPSIVIICCLLLTYSKVNKKYNFNIIKVFVLVILIIIMSETILRYINNSLYLTFFLVTLPFLLYIYFYNWLVGKVNHA